MLKAKQIIEEWLELFLLFGFCIFGLSLNSEVFAATETLQAIPYLETITKVFYSIGAIFASILTAMKVYGMYLDILIKRSKLK